ncbi:non-hydrolyzing UDP-N-acetylglucosamine 2-epimerase [Desulfofustis glycolicus]|uniref:UDP-N-acetylglucosamine 2-epimerase (Non-hydrolysing) n=1 Tax=Desulfofustis glycolicus DSM 9705 TaxID=1121409 RepID=A0A1M5VQG4_9BACT|nr:UDP-N-acetylglucosamine 2-epimerase (non-hydrolyzing) [Desulfofustis glycolicus]SHH77173.1 UDP-N-acetylglucosamine 2-epimerase (non-hydrolysing) [Desulfofustis glycolicus DSM 9705]
MTTLKIVSVVGARPNFMKIAPFIRAVEDWNKNDGVRIDHRLVHTGQHYDDNMSRAFFEALVIPEADINLGIGSGTHAEQVGQTMIAFEKVVRQFQPDWIVVVGDVNATCACSITAKKERVRLAHIEAGLRSGDMDMPEEINRLVTDRLSDLLFTPDRLSNDNLRREGVSEERIKFVGNIMIDTLEVQREKAKILSVAEIVSGNLKEGQDSKMNVLRGEKYSLLTLHRPSNVDDPQTFGEIVDLLTNELARDMPLLWTIHPRTEKQLKTFGLWIKVVSVDNVLALNPLGYHELLRLNMGATVVLTDSGGLQEECCVLGTPCLTLRRNTERPVTLQEHGGASILVGNDRDQIRRAYYKILQGGRTPSRPELWDGRTAPRIVEALVQKSSLG